jgi:hypothetical protein
MNDEDESTGLTGAGLSRRQTIAGISLAAGVTQDLRGASPSAAAPASARGASERVSVLDFGADPTGRNDSSPAFRKALAELEGGHLFLPRGNYLVERIGGLGPAGQSIVGESRWKTVLSTEAGGGPLFASEVALRATSAFHRLSDFMVDLRGQETVAIDLASINCSTVQRVHFKGGSERLRRGTGVRFAAPLNRGAYDNTVFDCSFEYLQHAIEWGSGANNNAVYNCRVSNCTVGYHAAPAEPLDTPRVFGGRVEACDFGLLEGAEMGAYFSVRFEDSRYADVRFTRASRHASFWGGLTATTRLVLMDLELATSPSIDSGDLGYIAIEESAAQPRVSTGRHVFGKVGKPPNPHPHLDYAAFFADYVLLGSGAALEFANPAGDDRIVGMLTDGQGELSIPGYDRKGKVYGSINFGGGPAIRPLHHGVTDLGTAARGYKALHVADGVFVGGKRVLGPRQPGIADDPADTVTARKINRILAVLRRMGMIES